LKTSRYFLQTFSTDKNTITVLNNHIFFNITARPPVLL